MKYYITLLFLIAFKGFFSQCLITGVLKDSSDAVVPFASIGLLSLPDSTVIKGNFSDINGFYSFPVSKPGRYILKANMIGFKQRISLPIIIDSLKPQTYTVNLTLNSTSQSLNDVSVYAAKNNIEFKNGNIIVNIEDSPLAKGNSVYDLLIKLPGVSIEENNIVIQGKAGVIVLIDNRPQVLSGNALINLLKSMNAELIKSIEVLKNPPVKYDASGTSGMINIISKKTNISGFTGSVFGSGSQGFYPRALSGISLNYKTKQLTFFSNVSSEYSYYRKSEKFNKQFKSDSNYTNLLGNSVSKNLEKNLSYKLGFDWSPNRNDVLGIKIEGSPGIDLADNIGRNTVAGTNTLGFNYLDFETIRPDKWNTTNYDINYNHMLDTLGSSFSIVSDYTKLTENISSENSNKFYDINDNQTLLPNNYKSSNNSNSDVISGRADLIKVLRSSATIESGAKTVYTQTSNDYIFERQSPGLGTYIQDTSLSNNFRYTELTFAGYLNYIRSFKHIEMQLGCRVENTRISSENIARHFLLNREYFNVFPNIVIDYKKNENHNFQVNLTRRIDRPNFSDLNPFKYYNDQYSLLQGNPFLLPDYANRAEISYRYKAGFSTSLAYNYIENVILSYTSQNDSSKVTTQSIKNMKSSTRLQYSIFYRKSIVSRWNMAVSGSFSTVNFKGNIDGLNFSQSGINYYGQISNIILLKGKVKMQLNGTYFGPNVYGIINIKPRWMATAALTASLFKDRLDLTLGIDDIFYTLITRTNTTYANQDWSYYRKEDTRRFRLAINYKFGKIKVEERDMGKSNEEESQRLNH